MSFFRYPGGKRKLRGLLIDRLISEASNLDEFEYREPFFGGGGIGVHFASRFTPRWIWINDKDLGVACLWTAVMRCPEVLKKHVLNFVPSVQAFDEFGSRLRGEIPNMDDDESVAFFGFMKLVIHQLSYSGLGLRSGGPLGGRSQASPYKIDCRWSPVYICNRIDVVGKIIGSSIIRDNCCCSVDFQDVIENNDRPALLYIDPPYYKKGNDLYYVGFSTDDHVRLADVLRKTKHRWVLSYDECDEIKRLYEWAIIERVSVNYSITATISDEQIKESRWKYEYVIRSPSIVSS